MTPIPSLLATACQGIRLDRRSPFAFAAICGTDEIADTLTRALCDSGAVTGGTQGHEYSRALGEVRHVHALKLGRYRVRIVGPGRHPAGQFSNLRSLEREVRA